MSGISQQELAQRMGVNLRQIVIWELSEIKDERNLDKIAAALGIIRQMMECFDEEAFIALCIRMKVF